MGNKHIIRLGTSSRAVVLRDNGNVVLADLDDEDFQVPPVLATSHAGCVALAEALMVMASRIRPTRAENKKDQG